MTDTTVKIYPQQHMTFVLTPTKIYFLTTHGQQFYLQPKIHYFNKRMDKIRTLIELGEIRDFNELASFCAGGQIAWVTTSKKIMV